MTRQELASIDANRVRRDSKLFALYKKYVTEDAKYLYASGKLPSNCFGCTFRTLFQKWRNHVLQDGATTKKNNNMSTESKRVYKLKNDAFKVYFKGGVLSNKSTGDQWHEWINYPAQKALRDERKAKFEQAPAVEKKEKEKTTEKSDK